MQEYENTLRHTLDEIGPSEAVSRFLSKYGNIKTKVSYASQVRLFLR